MLRQFLIECLVNRSPFRTAVAFAYINARDGNSRRMQTIEHPPFGAPWKIPTERRGIPHPWHRTFDPNGLRRCENERLMISNIKGLAISGVGRCLAAERC